MKFGKELLRAVAASEPVVDAETWLDYKVLKKMLKKMPPEVDANGLLEAEKIIKSNEEREFFRALSNELIKVETRFSDLKSRSLQLAEEFSNTDTDPTGLRKNELQELLSRCASAHLFVLLVENYAVLNYCGFTKILKKHDKLRSTHTKVRYMSKMVNERNFAKFDDVRQALEKLETSFERLSQLAAAKNIDRADDSSASTPSSTYSSSSSNNGTNPGQPTAEVGVKASPSAGAITASLDAQRRELEDIHNQGMDRLKSLAATALLSLEESENKVRDEDTNNLSTKRTKFT